MFDRVDPGPQRVFDAAVCRSRAPRNASRACAPRRCPRAVRLRSTGRSPGTAPLVSTPPVAMNLMQSAPALRCSRTARRTSHGPSDSRPIHQPWPPVMQMTRPATTSVGPADFPASIASRRSTVTVPSAPRSRTVVTPDSSALRAFSAQTNARCIGVVEMNSPTVCASPLISRCACALTRPGTTAAASKSAASAGTRSRRGL